MSLSTLPPRPDVACRRCGHVSRHVALPGRGVHRGELICSACSSHIKWLSAKSPEEREQAASQYRDERLASQPPTEPQIAYLRVLGYRGEMPQSKLEASQLIDDLRSRKRRFK
jgi:hypothetical protein